MKRTIIYIIFLLLQISATYSGNDSLLQRLDGAIAARGGYEEAKERELRLLEDMYAHAGSADGRYRIMGKTFDAYRGYDLNKGLSVAEEKYRLAREMKREDYIYDARMNMAEALCGLGMFKESLEIMDGMDCGSVPGHLKAYYFHIYRTIYGLLADFAAAGSMRDRYLGETGRYRDSIVAYSSPGTLAHVVVKADGYNSSGDYAKAAELVEGYLSGTDVNTHDKAILHFTLSEAYRGMGDRENEEKYLAMSATGDMESAVREYVSLRRLAVMLYEEGDIDRAYRYARLCMDDAARCNARWRILEVQKMFPIISEAYRRKEAAQRERLEAALVAISVLAVCLGVAIAVSYRQKRKVAAARAGLAEVNAGLERANDGLKQANGRLADMNRRLAESDHIKEEYVGHYLSQCSEYLDKMEQYRHRLNKMAAAGRLDDLYRELKSSAPIEAELKEFYAGFDATFLQIYPNFVEEFNALLREPLVPRQGELLNTELRIFALVRLGITDSVKIAQFLRYSVTTIYNYRTRVRNKAACERDDFENRVMDIGRQGL